MATLSVQTYDEAGTDLTMSAAAAGGDQFPNSGRGEQLVIVNSHTSAQTVTVKAQSTSFEDNDFGNSVKQDQAVSVSASGGVAVMGPFKRTPFNDGSGNVQITYSGVTALEIAVVRNA